VVADAVREEPGPPDLPRGWGNLDDYTGAFIILDVDGTGEVLDFPHAPEGKRCTRENYEFVSGEITWEVTERGSVAIEFRGQTHAMFPVVDDDGFDENGNAQSPWSVVRVNVCGSDREGGDYRDFYG